MDLAENFEAKKNQQSTRATTRKLRTLKFMLHLNFLGKRAYEAWNAVKNAQFFIAFAEEFHSRLMTSLQW